MEISHLLAVHFMTDGTGDRLVGTFIHTALSHRSIIHFRPNVSFRGSSSNSQSELLTILLCVVIFIVLLQQSRVRSSSAAAAAAAAAEPDAVRMFDVSAPWRLAPNSNFCLRLISGMTIHEPLPWEHGQNDDNF